MQNTKAKTVVYTSKLKKFTAVLFNNTVVVNDNRNNTVMFNMSFNSRKDARRMFTVYKANMKHC
jgi:hypothetical protein